MTRIIKSIKKGANMKRLLILMLLLTTPTSGFACISASLDDDVSIHHFSDFKEWDKADVIVRAQYDSYDLVTYQTTKLVRNKETKKYENGQVVRTMGVVTIKLTSVVKGDLPKNIRKVYWERGNNVDIPKSESAFLSKYEKDLLIALRLPNQNERLKEHYEREAQERRKFSAEDKQLFDLNDLAETPWIYQQPCGAALVVPYSLWNRINAQF